MSDNGAPRHNSYGNDTGFMQMRVRLSIGSAMLLVLALSSGCSNQSVQSRLDENRPEQVVIRFPYLWLDEPGFGGDIDRQDFTEPSGIVFHPVRKTLFAVGDEGEITEIETDGTPLFRAPLEGDLEGITVVPETGLLYVVAESVDIILEYDPDQQVVTRRFPINRAFAGNPNFLEKQTEKFDNGCESITFVPNPDHPEGGTFYIGNQWDQSVVVEVEVPLKSGGSEGGEARIIRMLPVKLDDPAAIYYDFESGLLNIVSDADNILIEVTLEGRLVNQYAFLGDNQEGLAKDDDNYLYIAQDTGGILKVRDLRSQKDPAPLESE